MHVFFQPLSYQTYSSNGVSDDNYNELVSEENFSIPKMNTVLASFNTIAKKILQNSEREPSLDESYFSSKITHFKQLLSRPDSSMMNIVYFLNYLNVLNHKAKDEEIPKERKEKVFIALLDEQAQCLPGELILLQTQLEILMLKKDNIAYLMFKNLRMILQQYALSFLHKYKINHLQMEVHYANALVNYVADDFGLAQIDDIYGLSHIENYQELQTLFKLEIMAELTPMWFCQQILLQIEQQCKNEILSIPQGHFDYNAFNDAVLYHHLTIILNMINATFCLYHNKEAMTMHELLEPVSVKKTKSDEEGLLSFDSWKQKVILYLLKNMEAECDFMQRVNSECKITLKNKFAYFFVLNNKEMLIDIHLLKEYQVLLSTIDDGGALSYLLFEQTLLFEPDFDDVFHYIESLPEQYRHRFYQRLVTYINEYNYTLYPYHFSLSLLQKLEDYRLLSHLSDAVFSSIFLQYKATKISDFQTSYLNQLLFYIQYATNEQILKALDNINMCKNFNTQYTVLMNLCRADKAFLFSAYHLNVLLSSESCSKLEYLKLLSNLLFYLPNDSPLFSYLQKNVFVNNENIQQIFIFYFSSLSQIYHKNTSSEDKNKAIYQFMIKMIENKLLLKLIKQYFSQNAMRDIINNTPIQLLCFFLSIDVSLLHHEEYVIAIERYYIHLDNDEDNVQKDILYHVILFTSLPCDLMAYKKLLPMMGNNLLKSLYPSSASLLALLLTFPNTSHLQNKIQILFDYEKTLDSTLLMNAYSHQSVLYDLYQKYPFQSKEIRKMIFDRFNYIDKNGKIVMQFPFFYDSHQDKNNTIFDKEKDTELKQHFMSFYINLFFCIDKYSYSVVNFYDLVNKLYQFFQSFIHYCFCLPIFIENPSYHYLFHLPFFLYMLKKMDPQIIVRFIKESPLEYFKKCIDTHSAVIFEGFSSEMTLYSILATQLDSDFLFEKVKYLLQSKIPILPMPNNENPLFLILQSTILTPQQKEVLMALTDNSVLQRVNNTM